MLNSLMEGVYSRQIDHIISEKVNFWGVAEEEQVIEFQQHSNKFSSEVREAINLMSPGTEHFKLDYDTIASYNESEKM